MTSWESHGLVLGGRRYGEGGLILDVLTEQMGRRSGFVYGGASRRKRGQLQTGNTLELSWSARSETQLGKFDIAEATSERAGEHMDDASALAAISAITGLLRDGLEEGDTVGSALYEPTTVLLDLLDEPEIWPALYVRWELGVLAALGFGLDLSRCAVSGSNDGLTHVSPRTGRAVKGSEAEDYIDRLYKLPSFLIDPTAPVTPDTLGQGFVLTGHFIERRIYAAINKPPPEERDLLLARLERSGTIAFVDEETG